MRRYNFAFGMAHGIILPPRGTDAEAASIFDAAIQAKQWAREHGNVFFKEPHTIILTHYSDDLMQNALFDYSTLAPLTVQGESR